jgi:hypothetical protein
MKRFLKVAGVGAAALGLMLSQTPAQAAPNAAVAAFSGDAVVGAGLQYPVVGAPDNGSWSLTIVDGVGANTELNVGKPGGSVGGGQVHTGLVNVFGQGAYCGASGGSDGKGEITLTDQLGVNPGTDTVDVADVGWVQSAATIIVYTGDTVVDYTAATLTREGALVGAVTAIPPNAATGGSGGCNPPQTAANFEVIGVSALTYNS